MNQVTVNCEYCGKSHTLTGKLAEGVDPAKVKVNCGLCVCKAFNVVPFVFAALKGKTDESFGN